MICEQCGQRITLAETDWATEDSFRYVLTCPNFTSAFMDFIRQEQITRTYDKMGEFACERVYELPLHYTLV